MERERPPFGFSTDDDAEPWLPQPHEWAAVSVTAQSDDPTSMLALYRAALPLRRTLPDLRRDEFHWRPAPRDVLAFQRGPALRCIANLSPDPVPIGAGTAVLLATGPLTDTTEIPPDTTAWLHTPDHTTQIAPHAVTPVKGL